MISNDNSISAPRHYALAFSSAYLSSASKMLQVEWHRHARLSGTILTLSTDLTLSVLSLSHPYQSSYLLSLSHHCPQEHPHPGCHLLLAPCCTEQHSASCNVLQKPHPVISVFPVLPSASSNPDCPCLTYLYRNFSVTLVLCWMNSFHP